MELANISQTTQILGEQYPILKLSLFAIIILIVLSIIIIFIKKFVEKIAVRSADYFYSKIKKDSLQSENDISDQNLSKQVEKKSTDLPMLSFSVPQRSPNFTGREDILTQLRTALTSDQSAAWKQALTGLGGKGKSQIAVQYAHRYQK
jgi:hypothetical protein